MTSQRDVLEKYVNDRSTNHAKLNEYRTHLVKETFDYAWQDAIEDYKASLVPVAFHIGNKDGSYSRIGATYNNESTAKNHIASYKVELVACIVPLYALSHHDDTW